VSKVAKKPNLSVPSTVPSTPPNQEEDIEISTDAKIVTEYVRRGQRMAPEEYEVSGLDGLFWYQDHVTPVQLRPIAERFSIFLKILGSDTPTITELGAEALEDGSDPRRGSELLSILILRWVLRTLHDRAEEVEGGNKKRDREREKWSRSECDAYIWTIGDDHAEVDETPPVLERPIQLTAQILAANEAVQWLAQALLLMGPPIHGNGSHKPFTFGSAEKLFSGRVFHHALATRQQGSSELYKRLYHAALEDLEYTLGEERGKRGKKERKAKQVIDGAQSRVAGRTSRFGALAVLDME